MPAVKRPLRDGEQKIEQFKFTRSEIDVLTVKTHGARQRIDSQTVRLNNAVRLRTAHRLLSAEQRLNAGNQLLHRERFCQIIIRPGFGPVIRSVSLLRALMMIMGR